MRIGDAFTFDSNLLKPPREAGNRALVLSERQAAVFADQRLTVGRSSDDILQGMKDRGITWGICWNGQFHDRYSNGFCRPQRRLK